MNEQVKILLQTTIRYTEDDWHIGRFSLLKNHLKSLVDEDGNHLFQITIRDRETDSAGNDKVLSRLDESDFDELWLFAGGQLPTESICSGRHKRICGKCRTLACADWSSSVSLADAAYGVTFFRHRL